MRRYIPQKTKLAEDKSLNCFRQIEIEQTILTMNSVDDFEPVYAAEAAPLLSNRDLHAAWELCDAKLRFYFHITSSC